MVFIDPIIATAERIQRSEEYRIRRTTAQPTSGEMVQMADINTLVEDLKLMKAEMEGRVTVEGPACELEAPFHKRRDHLPETAGAVMDEVNSKTGEFFKADVEARDRRLPDESSYYDVGDISYDDIVRAKVVDPGSAYTAQILKYACRWPHKHDTLEGRLRDLKKLKDNATWLHEYMSRFSEETLR